MGQRRGPGCAHHAFDYECLMLRGVRVPTGVHGVVTQADSHGGSRLMVRTFLATFWPEPFLSSAAPALAENPKNRILVHTHHDDLCARDAASNTAVAYGPKYVHCIIDRSSAVVIATRPAVRDRRPK
jgi:hypothetical protein